MTTKYDADDRGNVVDFYCNDEQVARLDREATVDGKKDQNLFVNDAGGEALEDWMRENGYGYALEYKEKP